MESEAPIRKTEVDASTEKDPDGVCDEQKTVAASKDNATGAVLLGEGHEQESAKTASSPTYESTEVSDAYITALALMKRGDFDDALEVVEEGMEALKQELFDGAKGDPYADAPDVHPSMAPYYYLYGTTLLYKVEERDLNGPDGGGVMVNDEAAAALSSSPVGTYGGDDDEEEEEGEFEGGSNNDMEEEKNCVDEEEKVEDLQIAWEFLESARAVLEKMVSANSNDGSNMDKYRSDLAQVRKREGDLNRVNGLNREALADFRAALGYLKNNATVGPYDRRVADLHYNLGLLYTLEAAASSGADAAAAAAPSSTADAAMATMLRMAGIEVPSRVGIRSLPMSQRQRAAIRNRGVYHFWECSKSLAGSLACLCGLDDPQMFLEESERSVANLKSSLGDDENEGNSKNCVAGGAKEDDFDGDEDHPAEPPTIASRKLAKLRSDLSQLCATGAFASTGGDSGAEGEHHEMVAELTLLLEEIQETIDEAERSEEGVQQVTEMKAKISAAVAAAAATSAANDGADGGPAYHGFGSAAAAASTAAAQPLMAVKKKSKRDASEAKLKDDRDGYDSKRPAAE
jgi:tetratricopeptide (TPR) repeat protein